LLTNKANDIKKLAQENIHKLSEEEQQEIRTLITLAIRSDNKEITETLLAYANSLALRRADWRERNIIKKIIINNINSGGGSVVMGNVNTGGGDLIGRDQKVNTIKSRPRSSGR
jgi:hypothetical protein